MTGFNPIGVPPAPLPSREARLESLLREALTAFNHIRNQPYNGAHKNTYALAGAIEKELQA